MISVVIGTFGSEDWNYMGKVTRDNLKTQTVKPDSIHHIHADSLMEARNIGAQEAEGEWLCFLDADDTLHDDYLLEMEHAIRVHDNEDCLLQPSHVNSADRPTGAAGVVSIIPACNILEGNFLIIGTLVKKDTFLEVGGFKDFELYEDWDLWIRCFRKGLTYYQVPRAIYQIRVRPESRNEPSDSKKRAIARKIRSQYK